MCSFANVASLFQLTMAELNDCQQKLFKAIETGDTSAALQILEDGKRLVVNCRDSTGMTPLSAAAYKGNFEVAERVLTLGGDANDKHHEHGYTPLMFAALAGKPELCKILLDHGARSCLTNSIGKTASELAAFVGQHECVSIINNHISIDDVEGYLNPKGANGNEEKFPQELADFIHAMCSAHVVHPIALILKLNSYPDALKYKKKMLYVVDRIFEKQLRSKEGNEVMSLKLWIILFILREVVKFIESKSDKAPKESALLYVKYLLQWDEGQAVRPNIDAILRNAVASFPYHQSLLFETMVKAMAKAKPGERPSAFEHIVQGLFGQRLLALSQFCSTCGAVNAKKRCPNCKLSYCSQECQKLDWPIHKKICPWLVTQNLSTSPRDTISLDEIQAQISEIGE